MNLTKCMCKWMLLTRGFVGLSPQIFHVHMSRTRWNYMTNCHDLILNTHNLTYTSNPAVHSSTIVQFNLIYKRTTLVLSMSHMPCVYASSLISWKRHKIDLVSVKEPTQLKNSSWWLKPHDILYTLIRLLTREPMG